MKRLLLVLFVSVVALNISFGQDKKDSIRSSSFKLRNITKDLNVQVSAGYGFPSILRFVTKLEFMVYVYETKGFGPIHSKIDFVYKDRISLGGSFFYNNFYTKYGRNVDTLHYVLQDLSWQIRANGIIRSKQKSQLYAGIGLGSVNFDNKTYAVASLPNGKPDTLLQTTFLQGFDKTTLEATVGYRYWPTKKLGFYTEVGIGRTILFFTKRGAMDSFIQTGITYGLRKRKINDR